MSSLALARDSSVDDGVVGTDNGGGGSGRDARKKKALFPTRHSRRLPPPVCPPAHLRAEAEALLDAPVGSLIVHSTTGGGALKSAEEEMSDAYYAADAAVQRAEYVLRGLNAAMSRESHVARGAKRGVLALEEAAAGDDGDTMAKEECFLAILDLLRRMHREGQAYDEVRTRVRRQLINPSSVESSEDVREEDGGSGSPEDDDGNSFSEWRDTIDESMKESKIANPRNAVGMSGLSSIGISSEENADEHEEEPNAELHQFGAYPGVTTHMYDLILDSLACLMDADTSSLISPIDQVDLMPDEAPSPSELAIDMLDQVLHRHMMDGGDVGLGGREFDNNPFNTIGKGIGVGAKTGSGNLAHVQSLVSDVRTCPTPMTFNAVLRIAANFDPAAYAEALENARVLGGDLGNATSSATEASGDVDARTQDRERLRDVTLNAALSTFSRMLECSALTLRVLQKSHRKATARGNLRKQAKVLAGNYKGKANDNRISGRNSATYAYAIRTLGRCLPPSLSRGNMTYALYHKGCVQEGVMDARLVEAMRGVGGYGDEGDDALDGAGGGDGAGVAAPPPPVSNGPLFDAFLAQELGCGVSAALENGRKRRQDRNYKVRRHVGWDDTY